MKLDLIKGHTDEKDKQNLPLIIIDRSTGKQFTWKDSEKPEQKPKIKIKTFPSTKCIDQSVPQTLVRWDQ